MPCINAEVDLIYRGVHCFVAQPAQVYLNNYININIV
jgi:hypothetical protein